MSRVDHDHNSFVALAPGLLGRLGGFFGCLFAGSNFLPAAGSNVFPCCEIREDSCERVVLVNFCVAFVFVFKSSKDAAYRIRRVRWINVENKTVLVVRKGL